MTPKLVPGSGLPRSQVPERHLLVALSWPGCPTCLSPESVPTGERMGQNVVPGPAGLARDDTSFLDPFSPGPPWVALTLLLGLGLRGAGR